MNFIDSEIKEENNDVREIQPEEPIVLDLGHEFENLTITTEKVNVNDLTINDTKINDNEVTTVKTDISIDEISNPEVPQNQDSTIEKNDNVENLESTIEPENGISLMTTEVPILDATIWTIVPIKENISNVDIETEETSNVEAQTEVTEIQQEVSTKSPEKLNDLSRFFEDEPSQKHQMHGFIKETDNEITSHNDSAESESESDSSSNSNGSKSSESNQDENKAAEDLSISEDLSSEKATPAPISGSQNDVFIDESTKIAANDSVQEIEAVTESTGEITNEVTVVANELTHTIMKKPGVDDESPRSSTDLSMQEETNEIVVTTPNIQIDPVVHLVINRPKGVLESIISSGSENTNQTSNQPLEVVPPSSVTDINGLADSEDKSPTTSIPETKVLDKNEELTEDSNSVQLNIETPFEHDDNHQLAELEESLQTPTENVSNTLNEKQIPELNAIPHSETQEDKTLETNLVIDDSENSTPAPPTKSNESSGLEGHQEDQPIVEENGIFKESHTFTDKSLLNAIIVKESVETSTERPVNIENPLEDNQIGTNYVSHDNSLPTAETSSAISNSIPNSQTNSPVDNLETSTRAPSIDKNEFELQGDIQEDQTSSIGIFKEPEETPINPIDESLPDPKLYEEPIETSTQKPIISEINDIPTSHIIATTTDYSRHIDSLQTMRDESSSSSVISDEVIAPASVGRSLNEIVAEGLGKPLPTRSVGDEPSSSSYSSEDKTTTVLVLCAAAGGIFIAFSFAIYLISFQRQHGTLDIEMQEQQCGKDNLDEDEDSETRVSLLNQAPTADSDEHSSY
ncbi:uncharacterized protein LOC129917212 [Episyrphus balteatus]|uniref:uncharacterized protein LOC129917212 n=1 Tax=Episyrphus balteatus TaxID=286459 RepID=UPI002484F1F3|nr:uncharacterized protein LOC129917212 [Episyrphus balteatus]